MLRRAFFLVLILAPFSVRAVDAPSPSSTAAVELTDKALDDMKDRARETLLKKTAEIEKSHADREAFAKFLKDQRLAFEKSLTEDMIAFLTSLKPIAPASRRKVFAEFTEKQRQSREAFNRQSRSKIDEFRRRNAESN